MARTRRSKRNEYRNVDDGSIEVIATNNIAFFIDKEDEERVKKYTWSVCTNKRGLQTVMNRQGLSLHQYLINSNREWETDHIDRDRLNNRRSNLRRCTHQQNQFNQGLQRNNTSGAIGVRFYPQRGKYVARIKYCGKDIHLGYYAERESAMQARNAGAVFLFGEFAVQSDVPEASAVMKMHVVEKCEKALAIYGVMKKRMDNYG